MQEFTRLQGRGINYSMAWGTTDGAHRRLTRNSMATYWNGGNNPDIDYGKMAYLPEISFTVESNDVMRRL